MDMHIDFLKCLDSEMAFKILMCLDDPADLVRATGVSRFWRHFVVSSEVSKQQCMKRFPQLSSIDHITRPNCRTTDVGSSSSVEWESHKTDHNFYASLLEAVNKSVLLLKDFVIAKKNSLSSSNRFPIQSIRHKLRPRLIHSDIHRCWSYRGQRYPSVPDKLMFILNANLWVVTEIKIQPFEAFFHPGSPIYAANFVRFRMGRPKSPNDLERDLEQRSVDDKFIWTYTSQDFPMVQESRLQPFKLPEPVLCIGGFLLIELFDRRVHMQEMDGLTYICLSDVQIVGRPLSPAFDLENHNTSGKVFLKYDPKALRRTLDRENIGRLGLLEFHDEWLG